MLEALVERLHFLEAFADVFRVQEQAAAFSVQAFLISWNHEFVFGLVIGASCLY